MTNIPNPLAVSKTSKALAKKFGFTINYSPNLLKTFRKTYGHLFPKRTKNTDIILLSNYRGNFRSSDGKYILDGRVKNSGTSQLYMFLPHLAFEENIYLIAPPVDPEWIDYLKEAKVFNKTFSVEERLITIKLPEMNSSPIETLIRSGANRQLPTKSLLITTFNDLLTKTLVEEKKLLHNQKNINSYEGNSKINQRKDLLPMAPSIIVTDQIQAIKAVTLLQKAGINKIWVKCGNNMGAGQFMKSVLIDSGKTALPRVLNAIKKIHNEQRILIGKKPSNSKRYRSAELMLEVDVECFGKILLEGSAYFILTANKNISVLHYAQQVKDPQDHSKAIGGQTFIPRPHSSATLYPTLMQELIIHAACRQRGRNYRGLTGIDLFIVEMSKENFEKYLRLLKSVGMPIDSIPYRTLGKKTFVGILGELNERETITPPIQRMALNLGFKEYLSTSLNGLPEKFDYSDLKKIVLQCGLKLSQVIPFIRKPKALDNNGVPLYTGMRGTFYIGIFANKDINKCYQLLMKKINEYIQNVNPH